VRLDPAKPLERGALEERMMGALQRGIRTAALLLGAGLSTLAASPALAQSANCVELNNQLSAFNGNGDFRNLQANVQRARLLAEEIRAAESEFVRGGCQAVVNAGQRLSGQCRALARSILSGRDDYNALAVRVETGQAVAQRREVALQQMARFQCGSGSNAQFNRDFAPQRSQSPFEELLNRIFGGEGRIVDEPAPYYMNMSTLRTVCVRSCDGYYWPISFSTVPDFLGDDSSLCASQCPGAEVELFYYRNPGEDADDMINLAGQPYKAMPNAFRYRQEFDKACTCKAQVNYGSIELASAAGGSGRATITFGEAQFPMPLRDPRRATQVATAQVVEILPHVPLPRPRPRREGEQGPPQPPVTNRRPATANAEMRTVTSGDRVIRIVGPDTPYVRAAGAGG